MAGAYTSADLTGDGNSSEYEPSLLDLQVAFGDALDETAFAGLYGSEHGGEGSDFGFEKVGDDEQVWDEEFPFDRNHGDFESEMSEDKEPAIAVEPKPVTGKAWNSLLAHAFATSANFMSSLAYPWEVGTMRAVFGDQHMPQYVTALGDSTNLQDLQPSRSGPSTVPALTELDLQTQPAYMSAVKSLRDLDYLEEKKAQMTLASAKWMELLSIEWKASSVGEQIAMDLQGDPSGETAEQTLKNQFLG